MSDYNDALAPVVGGPSIAASAIGQAADERSTVDAAGPRTRCQHILCKEMLVFGDEYLATKSDVDETGTGFWCQRTQTARGPDGDLVAMRRCIAGRTCYQPL
jgi:hypothetical protein